MSKSADVISLQEFRANKRGIHPIPHSTIAVTGGKGGVGKSFLASNLAVALGQRLFHTLVIDGDFGMADLNLLLGLAPEHSVLDLLMGTPASEVLESAHGIDLMPGLNGNTLLANLSSTESALLRCEFQKLRENYEVCVVDAPPGIGDTGVDLCAMATHIVLVLSPEPTSLADAYACLKAMSARTGVVRAFVVVNGVSSPGEASETFSRLQSLVQRFLGIELVELPYIPRDDRAATACALGSPVVLQYPDTPSARAIQTLLTTLLRASPSVFEDGGDSVAPQPEAAAATPSSRKWDRG